MLWVIYFTFKKVCFSISKDNVKQTPVWFVAKFQDFSHGVVGVLFSQFCARRKCKTLCVTGAPFAKVTHVLPLDSRTGTVSVTRCWSARRRRWSGFPSSSLWPTYSPGCAGNPRGSWATRSLRCNPSTGCYNLYKTNILLWFWYVSTEITSFTKLITTQWWQSLGK